MLRNPLTAGRGRWAALAATLVSFVGLFVITSGAQAVVVNDQGTIAGIALNPGSSLGAGVSAVTSNAPCSDPWLSSDFSLPNSGLCWHSGGSVIHANETFALTWDAPTSVSQHAYWSGTRGYLEGLLSDVAAASGSLSSPFSLTPQYRDAGGPAGNSSIFGGGCIDYGSAGGSACEFGNPSSGHNYPSNGCTPTGGSTNCLTDSQIQGELAAMIGQAGIVGHTQPGYTPLVTLLTPPGVETCLEATGNVCSINSTAGTQFCSYHSQVNAGGTEVTYVVQPWTAFTNCDDPSVPAMPSNPTPQQLSQQAGMRMASPLSQSMISALVNPAMNGWFALNGSEVDDNGGCTGLGNGLDAETVGNNTYYLQREFNNGGAISPDPYTYFGCAPVVVLAPSFVVPSAVNQGDVVALDGSSSATTLLIPNAGYQWNFGDNTPTVTGPSVEHSYAKGGVYTITLTVTDRGQHKASLSQTITVLGPTGQPVTGVPGQQGSGGGNGSNAGPLQVRIQLMPQALKQVLSSGIALRVTSNESANGFASVSIARSLAKRLHLHVGRRPFVTIGQGTLSAVKHGTVVLYLHLSRSMAAKIRHLRRVTLTVGLRLVGPAGDRLSIDAAGRY